MDTNHSCWKGHFLPTAEALFCPIQSKKMPGSNTPRATVLKCFPKCSLKFWVKPLGLIKKINHSFLRISAPTSPWAGDSPYSLPGEIYKPGIIFASMVEASSSEIQLLAPFLPPFPRSEAKLRALARCCADPGFALPGGFTGICLKITQRNPVVEAAVWGREGRAISHSSQSPGQRLLDISHTHPHAHLGNLFLFRLWSREENEAGSQGFAHPFPGG